LQGTREERQSYENENGGEVHLGEEGTGKDFRLQRPKKTERLA
jgi:hypothetical protein